MNACMVPKRECSIVTDNGYVQKENAVLSLTLAMCKRKMQSCQNEGRQTAVIILSDVLRLVSLGHIGMALVFSFFKRLGDEI